jgi:hypothetical protein
VDDQPRNGASGRLSRRDLIRRGAIVGGSLLWVAPAIQTLTPAASAQTVGSPTFGCCECVSGDAGAEKCNPGVGGLECNAGPVQSSTGPESSVAACQAYCAGKSQAYCFHSSNAPITCQPAPGNTERCTGS